VALAELTLVFVKFAPLPLVCTKLIVLPLGAVRFKLMSLVMLIVTLKLTEADVMVAPAGIPETEIPVDVPTAVLSGITTLIVPDVAVTEFVDVADNVLTPPLQNTGIVLVTIGVVGAGVTAMFEDTEQPEAV
jgi:hypothetical protein